jgi:cGMP-dependent protein kinase
MRDPVSNSFISQLLSKNPDSRLGGSYSDLKKHMFFQGFDWHQLINKKMKPCFELPKDKLFNYEKLKSGAKPLKSVLKPQKPPVLRKDMKENWDECF